MTDEVLQRARDRMRRLDQVRRLRASAMNRIPDLAAVREHFETAWIRWNVVRALASTAALGCLAWALVVNGRIAA